MLYYRIAYSDGLFFGGHAYIQARSLQGARAQIARTERDDTLTFDRRTLRRISARTFRSAR